MYTFLLVPGAELLLGFLVGQLKAEMPFGHRCHRLPPPPARHRLGSQLPAVTVLSPCRGGSGLGAAGVSRQLLNTGGAAGTSPGSLGCELSCWVLKVRSRVLWAEETSTGSLRPSPCPTPPQSIQTLA